MPNFSAPWTSIPADFPESAWGRLLGDFDADTFATKLEAALPVPQNPALQKFRKKLLSFTPSFVDEDGAYYLRLEHPRGDDGIGSAYYLQVPELVAEVEKNLQSLGCFRDDELAEFLALFPSLCEDLQSSGHFSRVENWEAFEDDFDLILGAGDDPLELNIDEWLADHQLRRNDPRLSAAEYQRIMDTLRELLTSSSPQPEQHWRPAFMIYHARNGDRILLHPDGGTAWFVTSEQEIRPIAKTFAGFLDYLSDAIDKRWPLDSYGS